MRKIVIANDYLKGGGVENVLNNIVKKLIQEKYEIFLMIPNCNQKDIMQEFGESVTHYPPMRKLKNEKKFTWRWFWDRGLYIIQHQFYKIIFAFHDFDVAIALKEGPTMIEISKLHAKKKIAWVHVDYQYMHWTKSCYKSLESEKKCMQKFEKVVCVSEAAKQSVIKTIGNPGNLCVRYNPINISDIYKNAEMQCTENKVINHILFVTVGRLSPEKNYQLLLDVCEELEKKYTFSLWIIGDGPLKEELKNKIEKCNIKSVKLLGMQKNPYPFIKMADIFVSSAKCESFGIAIQEALVLGKPIVAVKCPAVEETLNSKFGILVNNDRDALYAAMEQMIMDEELRNKIENNIKKFYEIEELYEKRLNDICNLWE